MFSFQCSKTCGRGTQERSVMCGDQDKHDIYTCSSAARPADTKTCYSLCPAQWAATEWSEVRTCLITIVNSSHKLSNSTGSNIQDR